MTVAGNMRSKPLPLSKVKVEFLVEEVSVGLKTDSKLELSLIFMGLIVKDVERFL